MLTHASNSGISSIGLPRIGCGIGGLIWEDVRNVLRTLAESSPVDIVVYAPAKILAP
jgi:O-acetyl-ADP-ribose deacetylase (regulator of RNase III)